jgi:hypothetical protein
VGSALDISQSLLVTGERLIQAKNLTSAEPPAYGIG